MSYNKKKKKCKYGQKVTSDYYGDFGLPFRGIVSVNNNDNSLPFMSSTYMVKNITNNKSNLTQVPVNYHSFGSNWYPNMHIDNTYSTYSGGYSYPNAGMGPYVAVGIGNYPANIYTEINRVYPGKLENQKPSSNKYGKSKNYKK